MFFTRVFLLFKKLWNGVDDYECVPSLDFMRKEASYLREKKVLRHRKSFLNSLTRNELAFLLNYI